MFEADAHGSMYGDITQHVIVHQIYPQPTTYMSVHR